MKMRELIEVNMLPRSIPYEKPGALEKEFIKLFADYQRFTDRLMSVRSALTSMSRGKEYSGDMRSRFKKIKDNIDKAFGGNESLLAKSAHEVNDLLKLHRS